MPVKGIPSRFGNDDNTVTQGIKSRFQDDGVKLLPEPTLDIIKNDTENFFRGTLPAAASTLAASTAGMGQQVAEVAAQPWMDDPNGTTRFSEWLGDKAQEFKAHATLDRHFHPMKSYTGEIVDMTANSMALMAPSVLLSIFTGSPAAGLALMGGLTSGEAYNRYRQQGYSSQDAMAPSLAMGAVEIGTELLPFGTYMKAAAGKLGLVKAIGKALITELPGEGIATALQTSIDKYVDDPSATTEERRQKLADYWEGISTPGSQFRKDQMDTFFSALLTTGLMSGTSHAVGYKRAKDQINAFETLANAAKEDPNAKVLLPILKMLEMDLDNKFKETLWEPRWLEVKGRAISSGEVTTGGIGTPEHLPPGEEIEGKQAGEVTLEDIKGIREGEVPKEAPVEDPLLKMIEEEEKRPEAVAVTLDGLRNGIQTHIETGGTFQDWYISTLRDVRAGLMTLDVTDKQGKGVKFTKKFAQSLWNQHLTEMAEETPVPEVTPEPVPILPTVEEPKVEPAPVPVPVPEATPEVTPEPMNAVDHPTMKLIAQHLEAIPAIPKVSAKKSIDTLLAEFDHVKEVAYYQLEKLSDLLLHVPGENLNETEWLTDAIKIVEERIATLEERRKGYEELKKLTTRHDSSGRYVIDKDGKIVSNIDGSESFFKGVEIEQFHILNDGKVLITKSLEDDLVNMTEKVFMLYNLDRPLIILDTAQEHVTNPILDIAGYAKIIDDFHKPFGQHYRKVSINRYPVSLITIGNKVYNTSYSTSLQNGRLNTLFHELGHYVMNAYYDSASSQLKARLDSAHLDWVAKISKMNALEFMYFRYGYNRTNNDPYLVRNVTTLSNMNTEDWFKKEWPAGWDYATSKDEWFAYSTANYFLVKSDVQTETVSFFDKIVNTIKGIWKIFNNEGKLTLESLHEFYETLARNPMPTFKPNDATLEIIDIVRPGFLKYVSRQKEIPTFSKAKAMFPELTKEMYEEIKADYIATFGEPKGKDKETPTVRFTEVTDEDLTEAKLLKTVVAMLRSGDNVKGTVIPAGKKTGQLSLYISSVTAKTKGAEDPEIAAALKMYKRIYNIQINIKTPGKAEYITIATLNGAMMIPKGKDNSHAQAIINGKGVREIVKTFRDYVEQVNDEGKLTVQLKDVLTAAGLYAEVKKPTVAQEIYFKGADGKIYNKREHAEQFGGGVVAEGKYEDLEDKIPEIENSVTHNLPVYNELGYELDILDQRINEFTPADIRYESEKAESLIAQSERAEMQNLIQDSELMRSEANSIEFNEQQPSPTSNNKVRKQLGILEELERWALAQGKTIEQVWIEKGGSKEAFEKLMDSAKEAWTKRQNKKGGTRVQTLQARAVAIADKLGLKGQRFYEVINLVLEREDVTPQVYKGLPVDELRKVNAWLEILYWKKTGEKFKYQRTPKRNKKQERQDMFKPLESLEFLKQECWETGTEWLSRTKSGKELSQKLWKVLIDTDSHAGQLLAFMMLNEKYIKMHNDRLLRMYLGEEEFTKSLLPGEQFDMSVYKNVNLELDRKILDHMRMIYNTIGKMMEDRTMVINTFDGKKTIYVHDAAQTYFPHTFRPEDLSESGAKYKQMVASIQKNYKVTKAEAIKLLNRFIKNRNAAKKFGNMEYARDFDSPGWIRDIMQVTSIYTVKGLKRMYSIDHFGKRSEKALGALVEIENEGGDYDRAIEIVQHIIGYSNQTDMKWRRFADFAVSYEIITKMGFSALSNLTQPLNVFAYSPKAFFKTFGMLLRKMSKTDAEQFAYETGSMLGTVLKEYVDFQRGDDMSDLFLRKTGFTTVEVRNRIFASVAGREAAIDAFKTFKTASGRSYYKARKMLQDLGLDVDQLAQQDILTDADKKLAGLTMSNKTQFRSNALTLPRFVMENPKMRLLTLLHTFSYHQSKLILDTFRRRKANVVPMIMAMLFAGAGLDWLKRLLQGRKQAEDLIEFMFGALSSAGGLGIGFDIARASSSEGKFLSFLAGPFVTDVAQVASSLSKGFMKGVAWTQDEADFTDVIEPIGKEVIEASPYVVASKFPGYQGAVVISAGLKPLITNYLFPGKNSVFE